MMRAQFSFFSYIVSMLKLIRDFLDRLRSRKPVDNTVNAQEIEALARITITWLQIGDVYRTHEAIVVEAFRLARIWHTEKHKAL